MTRFAALATAVLVLAACTSSPTRSETVVTQRTSSASDDCAAEASRLGQITGVAETATAMMETAVLRDDLDDARAQYDTIKWAMTGLDDDVSRWARSCRSHLGAQVDRSRSDMRTLDLLWRDLRSVCRDDLADFDFDC